MEEPPSSQAVEVIDSDTEVSMTFIAQLIEKGNYYEAKSLLLEVIKKSKNDEYAYNLLGYIERQLQNFSSSIKYYKKSLSINEDYLAAHHYIAMAYLEIDQLNNAIFHRDYLDLICLFGCLEFTEVDNAIKIYEKNNGSE